MLASQARGLGFKSQPSTFLLLSHVSKSDKISGHRQISCSISYLTYLFVTLGNKSKALTASISGSNLVGDHWMRSAINFVMDTTALIEVQNRIPQTIEELKQIEFKTFSYEYGFL